MFLWSLVSRRLSDAALNDVYISKGYLKAFSIPARKTSTFVLSILLCSFPENYRPHGLQKQISKDLKQQAFNNSESDHIHAQAHPVMPGQSYEYVAALLVHYL
jgi:hypothetical protein